MGELTIETAEDTSIRYRQIRELTKPYATRHSESSEASREEVVLDVVDGALLEGVYGGLCGGCPSGQSEPRWQLPAINPTVSL